MKPLVTCLVVTVALVAAAAGGVLLWYFLRPTTTPPYETIELEGRFGDAAQRAGLARQAAGDVFWWFYPTGASGAPVLLLLGGVSDRPASLANLAALGPLDLNMNPRNDSWVNDYNILFIDVLGTGFSRIVDADITPKNVDEAAEHLFWALESFYSVSEDYSTNPLFIIGQGHGAQYALSLAIRLQSDDASHISRNLGGVALGNPIISPSTALTELGFYLEELAYVDEDGRAVVEELSQGLEDLISAGQYGDAFDTFLSLGEVVNEPAGAVAVNLRRIVQKLERDTRSSGRDILDQRSYLAKVLDIDSDVNSYMGAVVGPALGLPEGFDAGRESLLGDFRGSYMVPAVDKVEYILQNTNMSVTIYNGNLDAISNTPGQLLWVEQLRWAGQASFLASPRRPLVLSRQLEGYFRETDRLTFYWVNAAGQSVPFDSPVAMRRILRGVAGY